MTFTYAQKPEVAKILKKLIEKIGAYPDALTILQNVNLIDFDQVQTLLKNGETSWSIISTIANSIKLNDENTNEFVIEFYGYTKIITGSNVNSLFNIYDERKNEELQIGKRTEEQQKDL